MSVNVKICKETTIQPTVEFDTETHIDKNEEAKSIVVDIISDIFNSAVNLAELKSEKDEILDNSPHLPINFYSDKINENHDYKKDFKTLLKHLSYQTRKPHQPNNSSLQVQIKKVIDEIKNIDTSEAAGEDDEKNEVLGDGTNTGNISSKFGNTNIFKESNDSDMFHVKYVEDDSDEFVLNVIDLESDEYDCSFTSMTNAFPSEDEMDEITLCANSDISDFLNKGDQALESEESSSNNFVTNAGEIAVVNPVPDPFPVEKISEPKVFKSVPKKKNIVNRFWNFITRKSSKTSSPRRNNTC